MTALSNINQNQSTEKEKKIKLSHDRHYFDPELAAQIGVSEAILVQHFIYWITLNKRKNQNHIEGRTWTYQKLEDIATHFPYLSVKQIERLMNKLVNKHKILKKSNHNKVKFDRTLWYAFEDEDLFIKINTSDSHFPKSGNRNSEIGRPIPDNKTDIKSISKDIPKRTAPTDTARKLAKKLYLLINENLKLSPPPNLDKWSEEIEKLHRIDKRSYEEIEKTIILSQANYHWRGRIRSAQKLRKLYAACFLQLSKKSKDSLDYKQKLAVGVQKYQSQYKGLDRVKIHEKYLENTRSKRKIYFSSPDFEKELQESFNVDRVTLQKIGKEQLNENI